MNLIQYYSWRSVYLLSPVLYFCVVEHVFKSVEVSDKDAVDPKNGDLQDAVPKFRKQKDCHVLMLLNLGYKTSASNPF